MTGVVTVPVVSVAGASLLTVVVVIGVDVVDAAGTLVVVNVGAGIESVTPWEKDKPSCSFAKCGERVNVSSMSTI